jgi:hypothetical protein
MGKIVCTHEWKWENGPTETVPVMGERGIKEHSGKGKLNFDAL